MIKIKEKKGMQYGSINIPSYEFINIPDEFFDKFHLYDKCEYCQKYWNKACPGLFVTLAHRIINPSCFYCDNFIQDENRLNIETIYCDSLLKKEEEGHFIDRVFI